MRTIVAATVSVLGALTALSIVACPSPNTTVPTGPTRVGDASITIAAACNHLVSVGCGSNEPGCEQGLHNEVYGANDAGGLVTVDFGCILDAGSAKSAAACPGVGICPP